MMQYEELTQKYRDLLEKTTGIFTSAIKAKYSLCIALGEMICEADNNRERYLNLHNHYVEPLIHEVREAVSKIERFSIENQLELVSTLGDEYIRISSQKVA